jgi:hypothetical protein
LAPERRFIDIEVGREWRQGRNDQPWHVHVRHLS